MPDGLDEIHVEGTCLVALSHQDELEVTTTQKTTSWLA